MDTQWKKKLYENVAKEVRSETSRKSFQTLRKKSSAIAPYPDIETLIGMLRVTKGSSYKEKDDAIHSLIYFYQTQSNLRELCVGLLLMAMWPALDHSFYKLLPLARCVPDLFSELYWAFIKEIEAFNLLKRSKIAINIQMNVEKQIRKSVHLESKYQNFAKAYSILGSDVEQIFEDPIRNRLNQFREVVEAIPEKDWKSFLRQSPLRSISTKINDEERLSMASIINDLVKKGCLSIDEGRILSARGLQNLAFSRISRDFGIRSGAARVKYFRAKQKLLPHLEKSPM